MIESFDAIVIGSGQGGIPLAAELARRGRHVAIVERRFVGGTCVNNGCTPSKAFLAAAHTAGRARRGSRLGVHADVRVDFPAVMQRVRSIIDEFRNGAEKRLANAGVELIRESARFTGERTIEAGARTLRAPLIAINTGAAPSIPPLRGIENAPYLTNETFFELRALPRRLIVAGGGYVGLELGQGMARAGSEVHVFHSHDRILDGEEPDASEALERSLRADGVILHLGARVESLERTGSGVRITCSTGESLDGDALLVATGRKPNTADLTLHESGVGVDAKGFVVIDDRFATACDGVYAIGDVAGQPAFTHVSWEDHRRLLAILDGGDRTRSDRPLAYTTFTEPQVARVGLTLEQAKSRGLRAAARTLPLTDVARGIEWDDTDGFFRFVYDEGSGEILGATLVGYETGELIHVFVALMMTKATWHTLDASVHVHPTYAEGLPSLARMASSASA